MRVDTEVLIELMQALALVEVADDDFNRFDLLAAHIDEYSGALVDASQATGIVITHRIFMIVLGGMIINWNKGGEDAALSLPNSEKFDDQIAADSDAARELVRHVTDTLHALAWANIGDDNKRHRVGKSLLKLAEALVDQGRHTFELAITLALLSRDLLHQLDDPDARIGQALAYRMLILPMHLPFLPDMPPTKFPPPISSSVEERVSLPVCLHFIEKGLIDQPIDLGSAASRMHNDPEEVIRNEVKAVVGDETETFNVELAFGPELIRWAFQEMPEEDGTTPDVKLRALLSVLCENSALLDGFQDDDLGYVYKVAYLGSDETGPSRLDLAMKTESIHSLIRCVVGLGINDVRANSVRDLAFASRRADLLEHIQREIAAAP
jgi:hypothetical protein